MSANDIHTYVHGKGVGPSVFGLGTSPETVSKIVFIDDIGCNTYKATQDGALGLNIIPEQWNERVHNQPLKFTSYDRRAGLYVSTNSTYGRGEFGCARTIGGGCRIEVPRETYLEWFRLMYEYM